jgi:non-specific serine/threonine protein kinase/serine/threonine-protein kinase
MSAEAELDRTKPQFPAQPIEGPDQWVTGARVGHFRLERKLGAGGMGQVWLAEQFEPIARKVAVKLIQPQFKDPLAEAFFQIERQALASLDHPNIARVYEAGSTTQGQLYLAMEWVDGMTLEEFAQARPERKLLLPLFVTVCRAVQHAHSRNIVHRDLKPQNILICEVDGSPQPKIIDFGIAAAPGLSASGGTQGYMSPEQAAGISDQRTGVYALGVVLLELLMSSRQGDLKRWKQLPPAARLRALATGAEPGSLLSFDERALLERALALAPDARISTAQLLGDEVARLLAGLGLSLLPRTPLYVLSRFVTRNWGKVSIAALVLLAMMGGSGDCCCGLGTSAA